MELTETQYEVENSVARVTLFRPEKMNAFTSVMLESSEKPHHGLIE